MVEQPFENPGVVPARYLAELGQGSPEGRLCSGQCPMHGAISASQSAWVQETRGKTGSGTTHYCT